MSTMSVTFSLLQDDDIPPEDGLWVTRMLRLFNKYPKVVWGWGHGSGWVLRVCPTV